MCAKIFTSDLALGLHYLDELQVVGSRAWCNYIKHSSRGSEVGRGKRAHTVLNTWEIPNPASTQ